MLLFIVPRCLAQDPAVGTGSTTIPIPGSGHDYIHALSETIDPASGSVSFRINVPIPPTRGISLPFNFAYDSNGVFTPVGHQTSPGWGQFAVGYMSTGGWSYTVPAVSLVPAFYRYAILHGTYTCPYYTDWKFVDAEGGRHGLGLFSSPQHGGTDPCQLSQTLAGGDLNFQAVVPSGAENTSAVLVVDKDGTVYKFESRYDSSNHLRAPIATLIEDRNGNVIQFQDLGSGAFTETDSAGRTVLSSSGFGSSGNTVSVAGLSAAYSLAWESNNYTLDPHAVLLSQGGIASCLPMNATGTLYVVSSITTPNGQKYTFTYDPTYGLLTQITYPTGAWIKYTWGINDAAATGWFPDSGGNPSQCLWRFGKPAIVSRTVSFDGSTVALSQTFKYSTNWPTGNSNSWTSKQTIVTTTDSVSGSFTTNYVYSPAASGEPLPKYFGSPTLADTAVPVEQTVTYSDANGATLKSVSKTWGNAQQLTSEQISLNGGPASKTTYSYGAGNVVTEKDEYDFGGTSPLRKTAVTYQSFPSTPLYPAAPSILDRPASTITTDGNGNQVSDTDYSYDQTAVASVSNLPANTHDETDYGASYNNRGNTTTVTRRCLQSCSNATTTYTYDETGQALSSTDACGNTTCSDMTGTNHTTIYSYADNYDSNPTSNTNALLTKITNPLGQSYTFKYAYADSQLIQAQNQNDINASRPGPTYSYSDSLRRLTETDYPDGGKTTIAYNDAPPNPSVTTNRLMVPPSQYLTTVTTLDGMGQVIKTLTTPDPDCGSGDRVDTTYDGLGRVHTVSNPYCSTSDTTYGVTTYAYDALGRTTQVTHNPDNSTILTSYTGRATQVQDEGNGTQRVTRISQVDGLGRLTTLCEVAPGPFVGSGGVSSSTLVGQNGAPAACSDANGKPLDITGTGFTTIYQYDALDNLTQVNQGTMAPRTFNYDSLSRLTSSANPESNTSVLPSVTTVPTTYAYDANGNLTSKNAPAPNQNGTSTVTTSYTYDALNRLTAKSYSDGTTPTASFVYDSPSVAHGWTATNPVGRLVQTTAGCAIDVTGYDSMGRITSQYHQYPPCPTPGSTPGHSYQYDLLGDPTKANLFGVSYTYTYNGVARLSSVTSSATVAGDNQPIPTNLMSGTHYNALGEITSDTLGYGESESWTYNNRGWLTSRTATSGSSTLYSLTMSSYAPNGDVLAVSDSVNGNWNYSYDQFNRLVCANLASNGTCATPPTGTPTYTYVYDRFGNRWQQNGAVFSSLKFTGNNPTTPANTNRIDGYSYDAAGNVIGDGTLTYTYDAENRLISVTGGSVNATYIYDGSGRRAAKTGDVYLCGSATATNWYLYDNLDRAIAVTDSGTAGCHEEIYAGGRHLGTYQGDLVFSIADWLGTERVRHHPSGTETCASLPFGDNLTCSVTEGHYESPIHFTGKERDAESGLDNFGARYDSTLLGRFMSPDPENAGAINDDPQSWNAYSYTGNNPANFTDPDGRAYNVCIFNNGGGYNCAHYEKDKDFEQAAKASGVTFHDGKVYAADGSEIGTYVHFSEGTNDISSDALVLYSWGQLGRGAFSLGRFAIGKIFTSGVEETGVLLKLTPGERAWMQTLRALGRDVKQLPVSQGAKTADFLVDGVKTEIKILEKGGPTTIKNAIETAAEQGKNVIIDAQSTDLTMEQAANQIARAQGNIGGLQGRVLVYTKDGVTKF